MRIRTLLPLLLVAACARPTPDAPSEGAVRFEIDMTGPSKEGWFDTSGDTVGLRGGVPPLSWNDTWPLSDEDADGIWEGEVPFAEDAPEIIPYKIFVTGTGNPNGGWERGDNRTVNRATTPVVRRAYEDSTEPIPASYSGNIEEHRGFGSGEKVGARDLIVWLPPGYETERDRRYPVLYLHDGQNVFDARAAGTEWGMDETALRLIAEGAIEPLIIVGVGNTAERTWDYTPTESNWRHMLERTGDSTGDDPLAGRYRVVGQEGFAVVVRGDRALEVLLPGETEWNRMFRTEEAYVIPGPDITVTPDSVADGRVVRAAATKAPEGGGGHAYADFLVEEVKPFIDTRYRTLPDRDHTAVGGSSFGGLATMAIGTWYPDVFGGLLVVSPSVWWDEGAILKMVAKGPGADGRRVWVDMGTAEGPGALEGARSLRDALVDKGFRSGETLMYVEDQGAEHTELAWAGRAEGMLRFLFGR